MLRQLSASSSSPTSDVLEELTEEEVFGRQGLGLGPGGVGASSPVFDRQGLGASSPVTAGAGGQGLGLGLAPGQGQGGTQRKGAKALAAGLKQR